MGSQHDARSLDEIVLPFSLSQREVWLDQLAWPDSTHLTIGGGGYLTGPLDLALMQAALWQLVAENEALRLVPQAAGGQKLLAEYKPELAVIDFDPGEDPRSAMQAWWRDRSRRPFALDAHPPWQISLLRATPELHGLVLHFHHLVMDGWGSAQLVQRWGVLYNALLSGAQAEDHRAQRYSAFVQESLAYRNSSAYQEDAAYWHRLWLDLPPPLIERRASGQGDVLPAADVVAQPVPRALHVRVETFARACGATPFIAYLSLLAIYLARISGQQDIAIGVPSLNRSGKRYKFTLGMFVGVLALRLKVPSHASTRDIVAEVQGALRAAFRHARFPLSEIGRKLQAIRHGRDALFDAVFSFERQDYAVRFGDAPTFDTRQFFSGSARYPLGVTLCEFHAEQDLELVLEGSRACFSAGETALLGRRFACLLESMLETPDAPIAALNLLPAEEYWALIEGWHRNVTTLENPQPFIRLFEHQAALHPEAVAVVWDGGSIAYGVLNERANRLAYRLVRQGAARGQVIAFVLERSLDLVVAVLAIAKAGAAFLPIDPDAPVARVAQILEDSGAQILLAQAALHERLSSLPVSCIDVGDQVAEKVELPVPLPGDLAYVLFTSGSTGRPKGVMIEHATLARRLSWLSRNWNIAPADRSALATQITFDPALVELCLPLIHGASIALPPAGRLLPETLPVFAARHAVTFMAFVPTTLQRFADAALGVPGLRLRVACCGGEVLSPETASRFRSNTGARLFNVYGPTEAAIFATAWECSAGLDAAALPIGQALDDTRVYVLDAALQPVPFEAVGEIYLGGTIARGYLNHPEADAAAFVPDPFQPGERLYRTGDLGRLGCDGELRFIGRIDRQIKLRGYRIELGEVEAALCALDGVKQAAVQLVQRDGKPVLHAWVAVRPGSVSGGLQHRLRQRLPDYMLPAGMTLMDALPENSAGKIDYAALPAPREESAATIQKAARTTLEKELLAIWQKAFPGKSCGISDNFFDLGGDSLAAIEILAGIEKLTGRKLPLHQLTENPCVEELASLLAVDPQGTRVLLGLSAGNGRRVPLYLAASGYGDLPRFSALAKALGHACDLYMLQPPNGRAFRSIEELAAMYAEAIAQCQAPPGYIAGFSVAGLTALETARCLRARKRPPRGLMLIDTVYPGLLFRTAGLWRLFGWLIRLLRLQDLSVNGRRLGTLFRDPALLAQVSAVAAYRPPQEPSIVLIKSTGFAARDRLFFRPWRRLWGEKLQEVTVPGMHGSMFEERNVKTLAAAIAKRLDQEAGNV